MADDAAGQREEGLVEFAAALVAHREAADLPKTQIGPGVGLRRAGLRPSRSSWSFE